MIWHRLCAALLKDDEAELFVLSPLLFPLLSWIQKQQVRENICLYRGSSGSLASARCPLSSISQQPLLLSASTSPGVVCQHNSDAPVLEIQVPQGMTNCANIPPHLIGHAMGDEWILSPYSTLQYVSNRQEGTFHVLTFLLLDPMQVWNSELNLKGCLVMMGEK